MLLRSVGSTGAAKTSCGVIQERAALSERKADALLRLHHKHKKIMRGVQRDVRKSQRALDANAPVRLRKGNILVYDQYTKE